MKIILIGSGELAEKISHEISDKKDCGYTVLSRVVETIDNIDLKDGEDEGVIFKKDYDGLCDMSLYLGIKKIVVALKQKWGAFPIKELLKCRGAGIDIVKGNDFYELLTGKLIVDQINPTWLIYSEGFRKSGTRLFLKRVIDLILSFVILVLLTPLIIITAVLIKIDSRGPIIFLQDRVGEKGKIFNVHKFRSMVAEAEKLSGPVWATEKDERITRVGKIIRKLRIDELPQLWNVLKGEMSFVGPRPEREFFVKQLTEQVPYYAERHTVKPGITGWAQVSYGYGSSVEDAVEKLNYDLFYTKNFSIFMDLMIVLKTIKIVVFGKGR
jgi:sugar transferase (PEP-CTERM system associated)